MAFEVFQTGVSGKILFSVASGEDKLPQFTVARSLYTWPRLLGTQGYRTAISYRRGITNSCRVPDP